jgi:DNA-binding MarR family transcriptional regulator
MIYLVYLIIRKANELTEQSKDCALEILEVAPSIMRTIRTEMRKRRTPDLSVPQFRVLTYLNRHPGASLSEVADHIGLTPPSMSKNIDGLVVRQLITRQTSQADRRRIHLALTDMGKTLLESAHQETLARLTDMLADLSSDQHDAIIKAMDALRPIFASVGEKRGNR